MVVGSVKACLGLWGSFEASRKEREERFQLIEIDASSMARMPSGSGKRCLTVTAAAAAGAYVLRDSEWIGCRDQTDMIDTRRMT